MREIPMDTCLLRGEPAPFVPPGSLTRRRLGETLLDRPTELIVYDIDNLPIPAGARPHRRPARRGALRRQPAARRAPGRQLRLRLLGERRLQPRQAQAQAVLPGERADRERDRSRLPEGRQRGGRLQAPRPVRHGRDPADLRRPPDLRAAAARPAERPPLRLLAGARGPGRPRPQPLRRSHGHQPAAPSARAGAGTCAAIGGRGRVPRADRARGVRRRGRGGRRARGPGRAGRRRSRPPCWPPIRAAGTGARSSATPAPRTPARSPSGPPGSRPGRPRRSSGSAPTSSGPA